MDCLFCNIASGKIPAQVVYEDPEIIAFHDIHPQAPTHILILPKQHIPSISEIGRKDEQLLGALIITGKMIAERENLKEGYRLVFNVNANGGQEIYHIHLHLLGGRPMHWPPG